MELREAKAQELADRGRVVRQGDGWIVFPLSSVQKYRVTLTPRASCECDDFELRQIDCKHIMAARITLSRESSGIPPEPVNTVPIKWPRPTFAQNWVQYDEAQTHEKDNFLPLLHDLCQRIQEPPMKRGRPPVPLADVVFGACLKVFGTFSARRSMSDLREAHQRGYMSRLPDHSTIIRCLENPAITPILRQMIAISAMPLKSIETTFAVDSSGFSGCKFDRWYDEKWGKMKSKNVWMKAHIMVGVKTHIITSAEVLDGDSGDSTQFRGRVKETAETFTIDRVTADKAYCSLDNYDAVSEVGGTGFLAFKSNATGGEGGLYEKMFHYFSYRREEFLRFYHARSNVESAFSSIKRKFGDFLRNKTERSMTNELLAKLLCHNLSAMIHAMYELGIDINLAEKAEDQRPLILKFPS